MVSFGKNCGSKLPILFSKPMLLLQLQVRFLYPIRGPGPEDLVAGFVAGVTALTCVGFAVYAVATAPTVTIKEPEPKQSMVSEIESIAGSYGNFQCKEAANAMVECLKKNKIPGEIITITYYNGIGNIWSDSKQKTISENGLHVGVKYNGLVYCNVHPYGLPESEWLNDFHATGTRIVTRIPF